MNLMVVSGDTNFLPEKFQNLGEKVPKFQSFVPKFQSLEQKILVFTNQKLATFLIAKELPCRSLHYSELWASHCS